MPQVQAAVIATTRTDAKAIGELGIDPDEFPEHVAAENHLKALEDQLQALVDAAWAAPVRTFGDAVLLAEIAQHHAHDWPAIGEADGLTNPVCYDLEAFGRLTMAVLALAGRPFNAQPVAAPSEFAIRTRTGTAMVSEVSRQRIQEPISARSLAALADASGLSADHLRYREVVAEIARFDGSDYPPGMSEEESEPALRALSDEAMALERKTWATPAKTLADVLLRGEMALYNENGIMDDLDDPEAYYDERSAAQLIKAVVDVLGGNNAS